MVCMILSAKVWRLGRSQIGTASRGSRAALSNKCASRRRNALPAPRGRPVHSSISRVLATCLPQLYPVEPWTRSSTSDASTALSTVPTPATSASSCVTSQASTSTHATKPSPTAAKPLPTPPINCAD